MRPAIHFFYIQLSNSRALAGCDAQIVLCEDIFRQKDLSISSYYMDVDENILATEEDAFMVANYDYCRNKKRRILSA